MAFVAKPKTYQAGFRKKNLEAKSDFLKKGDERGYLVIPSAILTDPTLTIYAKLVFGYLLSCARKEGHGKINPASLSIAAYCGISKRQVIRACDELKDRMWLDWERTGKSNEYRIYSIDDHANLIKAVAGVREAGAAAKAEKEVKH